jgi:hypothetical protein
MSSWDTLVLEDAAASALGLFWVAELGLFWVAE